MKAERHRWGPPYRTLHLTTRVCVKCALFRVTHHEGGIHERLFTTWHQGGREIVMSSGTPVCEPAEQEVAA